MRRVAVASRNESSRALKVVKELDAFPKVADNFKQTSASGGGISVVTFVFIIILVISEVHYYTSTHLKFDYEVDTEINGKIKINIDMTVAMRCELIGADILDLTGQDTQSFGKLEMDNTHYELSPQQQRYHEITRQVNNYMRSEYHAIQDLMWLSGPHMPNVKFGMPEREDAPTGLPDACRVHGSLEVNKVAGNFHITAGKYYPQLQMGLGHVHLETFLSDSDYNFTHRIDHFSFGEQTGGIINPLDGEEQVSKTNYHLFQYFMKIVPTEVRTYTNNMNTYQFSVTERNRTINHGSGSHGVPGIFVKYDVFAMKICVKEEHRPYSQFLVRLCGIVGGIFVVSGLLHDGMGFLIDVVCCRYKMGKYGPHQKSEPLLLPNAEDSSLSSNQSASLHSQNSTDSFTPIDLLQQTGPQTSSFGLVTSVDNGVGNSFSGSDR